MITRFLFERFDRAGLVFLIVVGAAAVLVPASNLLLPASSPLHVPTHVMSLIGKYLCYAILALALDLVWGYCGILSLGHGAFFALGGYAMGMYLMRQIGPRGVYAHPVLPDFMVFLNWKELPWFWHGFDMFPFAMFMALLAPGLLAFLFGWLAFRSRVTGVYLSIITQAAGRVVSGSPWGAADHAADLGPCGEFQIRAAFDCHSGCGKPRALPRL